MEIELLSVNAVEGDLKTANIGSAQYISSPKNAFNDSNKTTYAIRSLIIFLLGFMGLFLFSSASAGEVMWNPEFRKSIISEYGIKSFDLEEIAKAMKMVVYHPYQPKKGKDKLVGCKAIREIKSADRWTGDDYLYLSSALKECQRLEWIIKAKPLADNNAGVGYKISAASLKELPACFHDNGESSYVEMMDKAHARGESLVNSESGWKIKKLSNWEIQLGDIDEKMQDPPADEAGLEVTILGQADFNSDGIPDLMVSLNSLPLMKTYNRIHLLSKKKGDTVFRVLNPEFGGLSFCLPTWDRSPSVCLAPAVAQVREKLGKLYKQKQYEEAIKLAKGFIQSCNGDISDVPLAWLLNDLALAQLRAGKPESCVESIRQVQKKLYYYAGRATLERATATNYELCTSAIGK